MKLIMLSAFNGRLKSEVMEWPCWDHTIYMPVTQWIGNCYYLGKDSGNIVCKRGIFKFTNKFIIFNERNVAIYELIDIT